MSIDLIIPVLNRPEYVHVLLETLYTTVHGVKLNPIFVDNESRKKTRDIINGYINLYDGLPDSTKEQIGKPVLISLDKNRGFAGAVNKGFEKVDPAGKMIIMHNDCIPFKGWAAEMEKQFTNDDVAVVVPRTNYANEQTPCVPEFRERFQPIKPGNKDPISSEEIVSILEKTYPEGRDAVLARLRKLYVLPAYYSIEVCSFCMMVSAEIFAKYGKFDEEFWPRGYEDKYWFQPIARNAGICNVANYAYVHHFGNITSDGPGFTFPDIMKMNKERYDEKVLQRDKNYMVKATV